MATGHVGEFPVGSLVRIRERDWVVLPSDDTDIVCLRPLSGSESEICGIHREIEGQRQVTTADLIEYRTTWRKATTLTISDPQVALAELECCH